MLGRLAGRGRLGLPHRRLEKAGRIERPKVFFTRALGSWLGRRGIAHRIAKLPGGEEGPGGAFYAAGVDHHLRERLLGGAKVAAEKLGAGDAASVHTGQVPGPGLAKRHATGM
jgi:hypothetical protein